MNKITNQINSNKICLFRQSLAILFCLLFLFLIFPQKLNAQGLQDNVDATSIESELAKDILNSKSKKKSNESNKVNNETKEDLITFSARNISVKDAFATLARISNQSISVGSDIKDDETIAVIEIQDQSFEEAFFNLIDAAMVNYTSTGPKSYTVIKSGSANPIMIFGLGASAVDKSLPLDERKADLSYDNQDLATLLKDLANKYGIDIVLTVAPTERVSCRVRDINIDDALKLVLSGTSYDYTTTGENQETFVIYNRLNKNFTVGQESKMFTLMNLEAMDVQALLPVEVRANVRISTDQNSIIADGSINDLKRIEQFLGEIDKPLPQVELEVKLVEVQKTAMFDFQFLNNMLQIGRMIGVGTKFTPGIDQIQKVATVEDIAADAANLTAAVTAANPNLDSDALNALLAAVMSSIMVGDLITTNVFNPSQTTAVTTAGANGAASVTRNATRPAGLSIFNFNPDHWRIFNKRISFLESRGLANVRAYPKLLSLSGRTAMINIDQDTNLVLGSATGQAGSIAVATQQLQRITAGTALSITPIVGSGGLITAKINIEVSDNSASDVQNGVNVPGTTTRRRITADVQVRDGETVAIGGLITDNSSLTKNGIPNLVGLPLIGNYLSNRTRDKRQIELIVLITPTIRIIPEASAISQTQSQKQTFKEPAVEEESLQESKDKEEESIPEPEDLSLEDQFEDQIGEGPTSE